MVLLMYFQEISPKITDWIGAFGVLLGVPVTIYSIFKLFRKDKEQERKIHSLEKIAEEQNNVVKQLKVQADQLVIHSSHFQHQASLMKASNELFERQMNFHMQTYTEVKGNEEEKIKIQKQRRLNEIRPDFRIEGSSTGPDGFKLYLENLGQKAENVFVKIIHGKHVNFISEVKGRSVEHNQILNILGNARTESPYHALDVPFEIKLEFEDIEENHYSQIVKKIMGGRYLIEDPVLIRN